MVIRVSVYDGLTYNIISLLSFSSSLYLFTISLSRTSLTLALPCVQCSHKIQMLARNTNVGTFFSFIFYYVDYVELRWLDAQRQGEGTNKKERKRKKRVRKRVRVREPAR